MTSNVVAPRGTTVSAFNAGRRVALRSAVALVRRRAIGHGDEQRWRGAPPHRSAAVWRRDRDGDGDRPTQQM